MLHYGHETLQWELLYGKKNIFGKLASWIRESVVARRRLNEVEKTKRLSEKIVKFVKFSGDNVQLVGNVNNVSN